MEDAANRVAQVFVWKQGAAPELTYARQVLSAVSPGAFTAVAGDNPPLQLFSITGQWPEEPWPRVLQDIRAVKVQSADFSTALLARLSPNSNPPFDFDVILLGWTRLGLDPDPFALFHSSQVPTQAEPGLLNFTSFSAPEYDELAINGRSTYDYGERKRIYARTQEIVADQLPYYFLWARKYGLVAGPQLQGDIDFSSPR